MSRLQADGSRPGRYAGRRRMWRELDPDGRTVADRRGDADPGAVLIRAPFRNRQPEAAPFRGTFSSIAAAEEALEQAGVLIVGYANAGVSDFQHRAAGLFRHRNLDTTAGRRVPDRVVQQDTKKAPNQLGIEASR